MSFSCLQFLPKNKGKQVNLRYDSGRVKFVCLFFGRNIGLKKSFRLCLTFRHRFKAQNNIFLFKFILQITLIKSGWNELMILGAAYRSISLKEEGILVGQGKVITMEDAHRAGLGEIFDRVVVELVGKMEEMKMVSFCSKY